MYTKHITMNIRVLHNQFILLAIILFLLSKLGHSDYVQHPWGRVFAGEYCDYEAFDAACNNDESIIIGQAEYGHIAQGKCVKVDFGHFGCKVEVADILQPICTGKKRCSLRVDSEVLRNREPCPVGLSLYLKASYMCVKAVPDTTLCNGLMAQPSPQYISSAQAQAKHCPWSKGMFDQEYTITTQQGQQLAFSLVNLNMNGQYPQLQNDQELGYILALDKAGTEKVYPIVNTGQSESTIILTDKNTATVVLSSTANSNFLVSFKAQGCADLKLPSDVSVKRNKDAATVVCNNSPQTWELRCLNTHWTGVIGNCTAAAVAQPVLKLVEKYSLSLPRDIIFAIIGCTTFFIGVVVVTVGYVCLKWPKGLKPQDGNTLKFGTVKHMRVPSNTTADTSTLYLTPRYPPETTLVPSNGDYQPIWEKPLPKPPNNDQINIAGNSKRNNEDVYNMSLSSNSTDYEKKKYFVLDKDYMNTAELQQAMA